VNVLVFDIETVPDVEAGARLHDLAGLDDADIAKAMMHLRQMEAGTDFLRHHLHKIVAIAVVLRSNDTVKVWSLGTPESTEAELIERFYAGLDRYSPTLVSWNGGGFDLPVLNYRSLLHGVQAPRYWDTGTDDSSFRFNNYLNRFHERHTDLMDVMSGYQPRANVALDELATMLGLPGKMGMHGAEVWPQYQAGNLDAIRDYCETDVLNTYLIYLRFELIRGRLTPSQYSDECDALRSALVTDGRSHLELFLQNWRSASPAPDDVTD
jgi:3'-5' exonuclease